MKKINKGKKNKIQNTQKNPQKRAGSGLLKDAGRFPVVGIGASAGGLEALEQFFANVPGDSGMAYVVIQHLDPTREGILPELLQRMTEMKVVQVEDGTKVRPDCVYVIPSNKSMSILKETLYLFEPAEKDGLRLPIDFFLRSLAEDMHERAIGVILSGMGSDGSLGMRNIKEKSGITAIQEPSTAKYDSMPRSAADSVLIDITAAPKELPARLSSFFSSFPAGREKPKPEFKTMNALEKIIILIRDRTGNDFSLYKNAMVTRRVERRMGVHQIMKIADYVRYMQENPAEVQLLSKEMLIGVTGFFRDPKVWESLKTKIIPGLIAENAGKSVLRAWVPACSTGEEAYSLAIVFKEALEAARQDTKISLQIFATDVDGDAINKARNGFFRENIAADVSSGRLGRFFITEKNGYRVNSEIREMIVFAPQNVVKDPPFTNLDIISCRNLMIYLENELQAKLIALFRYSINLNGILTLGTAETLGENDRVFSLIDAKNKIYKCMAQAEKESVPGAAAAFFRQKPGPGKKTEPDETGTNVQELAEQLILRQFSPACVLVNKKGDIIYITGNTEKYLEPAAGKSSWNIFAMLREGIRGKFKRAFQKALKQKTPVNIRNINVDYIHGTMNADISMERLKKPMALSGLVLVVFTDAADVSEKKSLRGKKVKTGGSRGRARMENELQRTQENLQAFQEEMQTSQEELKSTNEELQSNNEELQSTNEELTTTKEETQSLNEELQTVNAEMQSKMDSYEQMGNDMKNLLNSTEIAVLFIDKELRITQYTFMITKIFKLIPGDIGRPFTDITSDLIYPEITGDITEVMRTLAFMEKDIPTKAGNWYRARIMPYKSKDDRTDGLVITFADITAAKQLETALRDTGLMFKSLMNSSASVIISMSKEGLILELNSVTEKIFVLKREEVVGRDYYSMLVPEIQRDKVRALIQTVLADGLPVAYETGVKRAGGGELTVKWRASRMINEKGIVTGVIIVGTSAAENEK